MIKKYLGNDDISLRKDTIKEIKSSQNKINEGQKKIADNHCLCGLKRKALDVKSIDPLQLKRNFINYLENTLGNVICETLKGKKKRGLGGLQNIKYR